MTFNNQAQKATAYFQNIFVLRKTSSCLYFFKPFPFQGPVLFPWTNRVSFNPRNCPKFVIFCFSPCSSHLMFLFFFSSLYFSFLILRYIVLLLVLFLSDDCLNSFSSSLVLRPIWSPIELFLRRVPRIVPVLGEPWAVWHPHSALPPWLRPGR